MPKYEVRFINESIIIIEASAVMVEKDTVVFYDGGELKAIVVVDQIVSVVKQ